VVLDTAWDMTNVMVHGVSIWPTNFIACASCTNVACATRFDANGAPAGGDYSWDAGDGTIVSNLSTIASNNSSVWIVFPNPGDTQIVGVDYGPVPCSATSTGLVAKSELTNIKFNHDTSSSTDDAINIRQNYNTAYDISNGEWVTGGANLPVCYTMNRTVTIKSRFTVEPSSVTSAVIWAVSTNSGSSLGDVISTNVSFLGGVSSPEYVTFRVSGTTPNHIQMTTNDVWQWKMQNINGSGSAVCNMNASGVHTVYTIMAEPVSPWDNTAGSQKNAWTAVLDYSCYWATNATDAGNAVGKITTGAYSGFGKSYDGGQTHTSGNTCQLSTMLKESKVDCRDMSATVQLFTEILGVVGVQVLRVDGIFITKPILAIGTTTWDPTTWNFHQFGWYNGSVYDACLELKQSAPYVPVGDNRDGNYTTNLFDSGYWLPETPFSITNFE